MLRETDASKFLEPDANPALSNEARTLSLVMHLGAAMILAIGGILILNSPYAIIWLGLPVGIMFLFFAGRFPLLVLLLLIICLPMETLQEYLTEINLPSFTKVFGAVLLLVCSVRCFVFRQAPGVTRFTVSKLILLWLWVMGLSLISSISPGQSLAQLRQTLPGLIIFFIVVSLVKNTKDLKLVIYGFVASSCIVCAFSLLAYTFADQVGASFSGFMEDHNFFVSFFVPCFGICFYHILRSNWWTFFLWSGILCLLGVALLKAESRAGLLATICQGLFFLPDLVKRLRVKYFGHILIAVMLGIAAVGVFMSDQAQERFMNMLIKPVAAKDPSLMRRASYVAVALENIGKKPWLGSGLGTYPGLFAKSRYSSAYANQPDDLYRYAHNTYLEMFCDIGIPGGLLFMGILAVSVASFHRQRKRCLLADDSANALYFKTLSVSLIGLILMLATISASFHKVLWLFIGLAAAASRFAPEPARPASPLTGSAGDNGKPGRPAPIRLDGGLPHGQP